MSWSVKPPVRLRSYVTSISKSAPLSKRKRISRTESFDIARLWPVRQVSSSTRSGRLEINFASEGERPVCFATSAMGSPRRKSRYCAVVLAGTGSAAGERKGPATATERAKTSGWRFIREIPFESGSCRLFLVSGVLCQAGAQLCSGRWGSSFLHDDLPVGAFVAIHLFVRLVIRPESRPIQRNAGKDAARTG